MMAQDHTCILCKKSSLHLTLMTMYPYMSKKIQLLAIYISIIHLMGWYNWRARISVSTLNITQASQWSAAIESVRLLNKTLNKWSRLLFKMGSIGIEESRESNCSIFNHCCGYTSQQMTVTRFAAWFFVFCIVFQDWMMQSFCKKSCKTAGSVYLAYSQISHTQERNDINLDPYVAEACALLYKAEYTLSIPAGESCRGLSVWERNRYRIWCEIATSTT